MHVVTRWQSAGTERNVAGSLAHEAQAGHEVLLVVGSGSDLAALPDVPVAVVESMEREVDPRLDIRAALRLRRLVQAWRPDVLHTHQSKAGILGRAVGGGVPCVVHTVHMASFGPGYGRSGSAFLLAERLAARRTDVLVTVGDDLRDLLVASGVRARGGPAVVVRSPVDLERFARAGADSRVPSRGSLGLSEAGPVVVAAGALEARKCHALAVETMAPLLIDDPAARFLLAGSGPLGDDIRRLADRLGVGDQVILLGQRTDLDVVFAAADVLLHTATVEGVPQVVVQAVAAGLPVVAVDVGGVREMARRAPGAVRPTAASAPALRAVVRSLLNDRPAPAAPSALAEWTAAAVERQRSDLLEQVAAIAGCPARIQRTPVGPISVVVPTHGRPAQLRQALLSVAAQTRTPDEVVVVDDVDDPATAEVVAAASGAVRRLVSTSKAGVAASRNLGLAGTTGDVVAFLDDDDTWSPNFLDRTSRGLTTADVAVTWTSLSDGRTMGDGTSIRPGLAVSDVVAVNPGFTGSNVAYRREALERVGGFDPALRISNDKDLLVRLLDAGLSYAVVAERLVIRGVGGHDRLGSGAAARLEGLQRYLDKHGDRMSGAQSRYLQGRMERLRRRATAPGAARLASTARMALLLGPSGVLQVRADDARSAVK